MLQTTQCVLCECETLNTGRAKDSRLETSFFCGQFDISVLLQCRETRNIDVAAYGVCDSEEGKYGIDLDIDLV